MMESIKGNAHSPLFSFWDANIDVGQELVGQDEGSAERNFSEERLLELYFMAFIPIISFFIHMDDWSDHYHIESSHAVAKFRTILSWYYDNVILPRYMPNTSPE